MLTDEDRALNAKQRPPMSPLWLIPVLIVSHLAAFALGAWMF